MTVDVIKNIFEKSIQVKRDVLLGNQVDDLFKMAQISSKVISDGGKLMLCGNGGSAADAQHLAAEMLVRLKPDVNRQGVPAIALAQDTSTITACGNDIGFDYLYERLVNALGNSHDVLIVISTSGKSENIIRAIKSAKVKNITVFGFLGAGGGRVVDLCDLSFLVPSNDTGRNQESHITAGHALMECIEDNLLDNGFLVLQDGDQL